MKKALFKSMSWILSVVMMLGALVAMSLAVSATQSATSGFSTNYTLSGDGFTDMVNIAMAQNEKTQGQIGYNEHWCADFVSDCARLAGQEEAIPFNGVVQSMYDSIINAGGYRISSPQAGDLVFFYNSGSAFGHVGIALDSSRNISGNIFYNNESPSRVKILQNSWEGYANWVYVRPNYKTGPHVHNYHEYVYYWKAHPHYKCYKCSCGDVKENINEPTYVDDCEECNVGTKLDIGDAFYAMILHGEKALTDIDNNVQLETATHLCNQLWFFEKTDGLYYRITNADTHKCLDAYDRGTENGTNVWTYVDNNTDAQKWFFVADGENMNIIPKYCTDKALDLSGGGYDDGTNVQLWEKNGTFAQVFAIYKYSDLPDTPLLEIGGTTFKAGENVNIQWDKSKWALSYLVDVWHNGVQEESFEFGGTSYSIGNISAGNYEVHITASNQNGKSSPGIVKFSVPTYTISYNMNGGTGSIGIQTKTYGQDLILSSTIPTRTGYEFVGWSTNSGSATAEYQPGDKYTANSGTTLYAVWKSAALTNLSTISETAVPKCTWVTLTGGAAGGSGSYLYAFYYKKVTSAAWTSVGEIYGKQTQVMFGPAATGTYKVKINVKDSAGTVVTKQFTLTSTAPSASDLQNKSVIGSKTIVKGQPITVTGKAAGGSGSYTYAFYYKKTTSKAFTAIGTEYGTASSVVFTPAAKADYNVRINVKDSTGRIVTMQYKLTAAEEPAAVLTNNSTISSARVQKGTPVTVTAKASGGSGSYSYAFYYKKSTSSQWTAIGTEFGTASTAVFTPAMAAAYNVKTVVMDSTGAIAEKVFAVVSAS